MGRQYDKQSDRQLYQAAAAVEREREREREIERDRECLVISSSKADTPVMSVFKIHSSPP